MGNTSSTQPGIRSKGTISSDKQVAATKSDTVDQTDGISRGFILDDSSQTIIKYDDAQGNTHTLSNMALGVVHSLMVRRVWSTTTTATVILVY